MNGIVTNGFICITRKMVYVQLLLDGLVRPWNPYLEHTKSNCIKRLKLHYFNVTHGKISLHWRRFLIWLGTPYMIFSNHQLLIILKRMSLEISNNKPEFNQIYFCSVIEKFECSQIWLSNDMNIVVKKNHLRGKMFYRNADLV